MFVLTGEIFVGLCEWQFCYFLAKLNFQLLVIFFYIDLLTFHNTALCILFSVPTRVSTFFFRKKAAFRNNLNRMNWASATTTSWMFHRKIFMHIHSDPYTQSNEKQRSWVALLVNLKTSNDLINVLTATFSIYVLMYKNIVYIDR